MPELPEVEIMARGVRRRLGGARLVAVALPDPKVLAGGDLLGLVGRLLGEVGRRGKYLCLDFDGRLLVIEPRMTGQVVDDAGDRVGPSGRARRVRLVLRFEGGGILGFDDPRRLGAVHVVEADAIGAFFAGRHLGPEAWPVERAPAWWVQRFSGARGPLKPALMDQARVAGIGNIGASEACWRAGLSPWRPAGGLSLAEWEAMGAAVRGWIEDTLAEEGEGEIHLLTQGGENLFRVYGRSGEPCLRCGQMIARAVQSGRATFWCAACQGASPLIEIKG